MGHSAERLPAPTALLLLLVAPIACSEGAASTPAVETGEASQGASEAAERTGTTPGSGEASAVDAPAQPRPFDADFPLHGLVTGLQLPVRAAPDPDADPVGWLRIGARVRLGSDQHRTPTCNSGWYPVHPVGFACAGQGIEVGETPPTSELAAQPPARDAALPYQYWYVKDPMSAEYHGAPSREAQRAASTFSDRYLEILRDNEDRAARMLAGELANEPERPAAVHRYLDRGFFVAGAGSETRASRRFVRTVRGRYVKQSQLIERTGSSFVGVELGDERQLPVAWVVRSAHPRIKRVRHDGTVRFVRDMEMEPIERHTVLSGWLSRENVDGEFMHVLEGERYIRDWFVAVAEPLSRPRGVAEEEPWVHVSLEQQTLVLYEGDRPVFATLVSTGQEGYETPTGTFAIHRKYVADTMANLGGGMDDRYSIEDVPWTQYFEGSFALHGAFWHERFGLTRSHGCVNLSPSDARRVFDALWPRVPDGWLGVATDGTSFRPSHVVVTP